MIDGIKIRLNPDVMRTSDILDFKRKDQDRETAKYNGMIVELYQNSCFARGSLHKYKNQGIHNYDDFKLSEFIRVVNDLAMSFDLDPELTEFHSLEFGVNIDLPFNPKDFINSIVFCNNGYIERNGKGCVIKFSEYDVKIYTKRDRERNKTLLRYEIRLKKMRRLRKHIINSHNVFSSSLADLAAPDLWRLLGSELLNVYNELLIVRPDGVKTSAMDKNDVDLFTRGCKPGYWDIDKWISSQDDEKSKKRNRQKRLREMQAFKEILHKYSLSEFKERTKNLISEKINFLIDVAKSPFGKMDPEDKSEKNHRLGDEEITAIDVVKSPFGDHEKSANLSQNHPLDNWGFCDKLGAIEVVGDFDAGRRKNTLCEDSKNTLCIVTGLSLDIGIKQGKHLTAKGVEYYFINHEKKYTEILKPRLSTKWISEPLNIQFREIAHSIRNAISNPRNNAKRLKRKISE